VTVLVTGATGFVGINIVHKLAARGRRVIALTRREPDAATMQFLGELQSAVQFMIGDVRDRDGLRQLVQQHQVRRIVHAAAVTPPLEIEQTEPSMVVDVNLGGTLNVLEAARRNHVERVVMISSTAVYGAPADRRRLIREDDPLQIDNLYTICKQAGEQLCRRYATLFQLSTVVGRLGTAYGPMERGTASRQRMSPVHVLAHAALEQRPLKLYGIELLRDVCSIDDVAEAFARLVDAEHLTWDIYNVSAGQSHSLREIATVMTTLIPTLQWQETSDAVEASIAVFPASERGPLDLSRLHNDLDFRPQYQLEDGLRHYLHWLGATASSAPSNSN
jgi:UDP-glucose 4-epimerase